MIWRLAPGTCIACFVAMVCASSSELVFSIPVKLSWPENLMVTVIAATLAIGLVFTILELRSLTGKER